MSDTKYAYAVARIRALENGLFSSAQIEQLLSVKSYEGALRFLTEHGWGDADTPLSAEAILTREKTKTWEKDAFWQQKMGSATACMRSRVSADRSLISF